MKFKLKKDWYLEDFFDKVKIYDEGQIFTPTEDSRYLMKRLNGSEMYLTYENMLNAKSEDELLFEPIEELDIIVEEINDEIIEDTKKWRIQLDVNTTQSKLKDIQKFIQENIPDML